MGRIAPNYYVQDSVIPRTRLAEVLGRIEELGRGVRPPGGERLPRRRRQPAPARLLRRRRSPGEAERAEELAGLIVKACVDAGGSITGEHGVGVDKKRYMPAMFDEPDLATFQRLRCAFDPDQPRQPRARSCPRRGCAARCPAPTAGTRSSRPGWRSGSDGTWPTRAPATREELAAALADAAEAGTPVRFGAAAPSWRWAPAAPEGATSSCPPPGSTAIVEHNAGDLTAVLEAGRAARRGAGACSPRRARCSRSTRRGRRAAPHDRRRGRDRRLRAAARPLRRRRATWWSACAWRSSDGTLAKSGGKVIKNVAGYDLAKLFGGSFGTLGAIVEVSVRLHPLPPATRHRRRAQAHSPDQLARGARGAGARRRSSSTGLDVRWAAGARACVLARFARRGAAAAGRGGRGAAARARGSPRRSSTTTSRSGTTQRAAQRGPLVVKVSGAPHGPRATCARRGRAGRARWWAAPALGLSWLRLRGAERGRRASGCGATSRSPWCRTARPIWTSTRPGRVDPGASALMRRVKERFDPAGVCV